MLKLPRPRPNPIQASDAPVPLRITFPPSDRDHHAGTWSGRFETMSKESTIEYWLATLVSNSGVRMRPPLSEIGMSSGCHVRVRVHPAQLQSQVNGARINASPTRAVVGTRLNI